MDVNFRANAGTDSVPNWITIGTDGCVFGTGAGSSPNFARPIIRPSTGYVWTEEMWIGPATFLAGQKVANWCKPSAATQSGLVFKVDFSGQLLSAPFISAYDDDSFSTWAKEILAGTITSKFKSLLKAYVTGREISHIVPPVNWAYIDTGKIGNANPNCLSGNTSFVTVPFIPGPGEDFTFTVALAVPHDSSYGRDGKYDPIIAVTFVHV